MPANECFAYYEPGTRITCKATAAVTGKRLVTVTGNRTSGSFVVPVQANDTVEGGVYQVAHAVADGVVVGVAGWDAAINELVPVIMDGVVPVTADAAIAFGVAVGSGALGKVKTAVGTTRVIGVAMTAASGVDVDAEIKLTLANINVGT